MSDTGDHVPEMPPATLLDDTTIDAILDGGRVPHEVDQLAAFAAGVRAVGEGPAPRPSPELAALLTGDAPPAAAMGGLTRVMRRTPRRSALAKAAGLGLVAKVGFATTAVAAGVVGAGAAGVLPGDASRVVRDAIEVVTPVEFSNEGDRLDRRDDLTGESDTEAPSLPGDHGDRVSSDATGDADGEPGVDGPTVAEQAPGAAQRPAEPPGQSGATPPAADPPGTGAEGAPGAPSGSPPSTVPPTPTVPETPAATADASGNATSPAP